MKLKGQTVEPPKPIAIPLPREGGDDLILFAAPVMNYDEFDKLCPAPKPPVGFSPKKDKSFKPDTEDPTFKEAVEKHATQRSNWMIITSLTLGTPELEWEKVKLEDPETWTLLEEELTDSFSVTEVDFIMSKCFEASLPSDERRDEALRRFLQPQGEEGGALSQGTELDSTISGEDANG